MLNIAKEVSVMERMTVDELRGKYADVFGEKTNGRNKQWLIKRIAWRMQANVEGDLSERARRRAMELANDADLRVTPPREPKIEEKLPVVTRGVQIASDNRLPLPGAILKREYKGRVVRVKVLLDGFEFEGERYKSLTAVAKAVTGKHWNGYHFFNLRKNGGEA
jgi:hypothetical protein